MITNWNIFNFKSVRQETELEIAPLTVFAGANSSGKSTFLQSILLVSQTLANKVSSRSVVLNGAMTKLGQFDDLKSSESEAKQIAIGWTCKPVIDPQKTGMRVTGYRHLPIFYGRSGLPISSVSCEMGFDADESGAQRDATQIQPRLFSSVVTAVTRDTEGGDSRFSIGIRRATEDNMLAKHRWAEAIDSNDVLLRSSLQYEIVIDDGSSSEIREDLCTATPIGCILRHFLPDRIAIGIDLVPETARAILSVVIGEGPRRGVLRRHLTDRETKVPIAIFKYILAIINQQDAEWYSDLMGLLDRQTDYGGSSVSLETFVEAFRRIPLRVRMEIRRHIAEDPKFEEVVKKTVGAERGEDLDVVLYRTPSALADACLYLDQFFSTSVRYLGPLRDEPKALYPLSPTADPLDVGLKGEHTAAVLELHKNRKIRYIPSSGFTGDEIRLVSATRTLEAAVTDWLQYLGVAESIQSRDKGKFGHELVVGISGGKRNHDLTHVGVGVSQVLPILVASLLAEPDTTLIFEQPELHLHPRVQTLLADFFLSMTQLGKQCIIETHSEYLVSRIRFRTAAASTSNPWLEAVRLYFVERYDDGSVFSKVGVNEFGAILDWPDGFFDQGQREAEAILRVAAAKRKKQRSK